MTWISVRKIDYLHDKWRPGIYSAFFVGITLVELLFIYW
jgi:hypothetical protein